MYFDDEGETPKFNRVDDRGELKLCDKEFERVELVPSPGVTFWGDNDIVKITVQLAEAKDMEIDRASRRFGVLRLREGRWFYNSALGVYGALSD